MTLTQAEILRYTRQLPLLTPQGQTNLKQARVLVIGAGGLGCPALLSLCAAGVGELHFVDDDAVETSNLHRQFLYKESDTGKPKTLIATQQLKQLNSHCSLHPHTRKLDEKNANALITNMDVVLDATDNFDTRYLLNRTCRLLGVPLISASLFQFSAQLSTYNFKEGPCYECLYPVKPHGDALPNCALGGVLGPFAATVGNLQALEAIKLLATLGPTLSGRVLTLDAWNYEFKTFTLRRLPTCTKHTCSKETNPMSHSPEKKANTLTPHEAQAKLNNNPQPTLLDVREGFECEICKLPNSLNIPLGELKEKATDLDPKNTYVVYCKAGRRGNTAALLLEELGFKKVYNLEGGILNWRETLAPELKKY